MAESKKKRVCKDSGALTTESVCPITGSKNFLDKYKGEVFIFDPNNSKVADKLGLKHEGNFAMKYG